METMSNLLPWVGVTLLVVAGLAGTILPALPGVPLVFAGLFLAAYLDDFQRVGWFTLSLLGGLTVLSMVLEFVTSALGAKRAGASKLALVGALVGSLLGVFSGLWGLLLFPFIGAVLGEWIVRQNLDQASRVGLATWLGMIVGMVLKLAIAFAMIGTFILAYFIR